MYLATARPPSSAQGWRRGMGENGDGAGVPVGGALISFGTETGAAVATTAAGAAAAGAPVMASLAVPLIGAAIAGVILAINLFRNRMGPKQKVWTTQIVEEAAALMQDNLDAWASSEKYRSQQAAALENFDVLWSMVKEKCGDPRMGEPGRRCIAERQRGGAAPWCPLPGGVGCDYFVQFRDPIAQDPDVQPDPTLGQTLGQQLGFRIPGLEAGGMNIATLLIPAALLAGLLVAVKQ